jgi:hypothetical protein
MEQMMKRRFYEEEAKMADITKCKNENCKLKEDCYRYTALDGYYQSYFTEWDKEVNNAAECEYFWDNEK